MTCCPRLADIVIQRATGVCYVAPATLAITLHKLLFYFRYSLFTLILCLAALHGALQLSIVVITLVTNVAYQLRIVFADF